MPDFSTWLNWANDLRIHPIRDIATIAAVATVPGVLLWLAFRRGKDDE